MNALLRKLNYKDQSLIWVVDPPANFESALDEMMDFADVQTGDAPASVSFALAFATTQAQVSDFADRIGRSTEGDATIWIAYPKMSSKRLRCEFNRDTGWEPMGARGFEPVRQIALDEDWSALRFRRVEFIKTMTRSFAMTEEGKAKAQAKVSAG